MIQRGKKEKTLELKKGTLINEYKEATKPHEEKMVRWLHLYPTRQSLKYHYIHESWITSSGHLVTSMPDWSSYNGKTLIQKTGVLDCCSAKQTG